MSFDEQLKLQAYLDGELDEREAAAVRDLLARDPAAQALLAELQNTHKALTGHGADLKLPESGDFHWSKIKREIERQARPVQTPRKSWLREFSWRWLMPVGAVACLLALWVTHSPVEEPFLPETELASDDMGAYTYRDQESGMTMIWLYDRKDESQFTDSGALASVHL